MLNFFLLLITIDYDSDSHIDYLFFITRNCLLLCARQCVGQWKHNSQPYTVSHCLQGIHTQKSMVDNAFSFWVHSKHSCTQSRKEWKCLPLPTSFIFTLVCALPWCASLSLPHPPASSYPKAEMPLACKCIHMAFRYFMFPHSTYFKVLGKVLIG